MMRVTCCYKMPGLRKQPRSAVLLAIPVSLAIPVLLGTAVLLGSPVVLVGCDLAADPRETLPDQIAKTTVTTPFVTIPVQTIPVQTTRAIITLTGIRLTQGNAVDCPTLRDDAGGVHVLSYLSPAVAIGARVTVAGFYGITTGCRGTVLVVQQETIPDGLPGP